MVFVSIDPGITTGLCVSTLNLDKELTVFPDQQQLTHAGLYQWILRWAPDYVICEDFEYRPGEARPAVVLYPLELIGVVEYYCQTSHIKLARQKASEGKGYYTNDKLKDLDIYAPAIPHGMDAVRHMMHWFTFKEGFKYKYERVVLI